MFRKLPLFTFLQRIRWEDWKVCSALPCNTNVVRLLQYQKQMWCCERLRLSWCTEMKNRVKKLNYGIYWKMVSIYFVQKKNKDYLKIVIVSFAAWVHTCFLDKDVLWGLCIRQCNFLFFLLFYLFVLCALIVMRWLLTSNFEWLFIQKHLLLVLCVCMF